MLYEIWEYKASGPCVFKQLKKGSFPEAISLLELIPNRRRVIERKKEEIMVNESEREQRTYI